MHAKVAPYTAEAVKSSKSLTEEVDVRSLLQNRSRLKHFFTNRSKEAPCILMTRVQPSFRKAIDDHNRSTKRRIGRLKELINKKIRDEPTQLTHFDLRLSAHLCNMEISEF